MGLHDLDADSLERLAQRRANAKMGWYIHALVFVIVNIGLAVLSAASPRPWAIFPFFGWGLGLLIHAAVVFITPPGSGFRERLVQQERERLERSRGG